MRENLKISALSVVAIVCCSTILDNNATNAITMSPYEETVKIQNTDSINQYVDIVNNNSRFYPHESMGKKEDYVATYTGFVPEIADEVDKVSPIKELKNTTASTSQFSLDIENIKEYFGFTNDDLAKVFNVSRKTIHNWRVGSSSPNSKEKRERIFALGNILDDWKDIVGSSLDFHHEKRLFNDKSIKDLFSEETLDRDKIIFFAQSIRFLTVDESDLA